MLERICNGFRVDGREVGRVVTGLKLVGSMAGLAELGLTVGTK